MPALRRYGNRRLYDPSRSRYVNFADVAEMVRLGEAVSVADMEGRDLTREVLIQVILEAEGGPEMLPVGLLRRIIRLTGDAGVNRLLRPGIAAALELLHGQLDEAESRLQAVYGAGADGTARRPTPAESPPPVDAPRAKAKGKRRGAEPVAGASTEADDLADLRARLGELERRLQR